MQEVMQSFGDIKIAYGESDEYSFVFSKTCTLYGVFADTGTLLGLVGVVGNS
jgi:tRNA(His) 5'-end guanylyltransferase